MNIYLSDDMTEEELRETRDEHRREVQRELEAFRRQQGLVPSGDPQSYYDRPSTEQLYYGE